MLLWPRKPLRKLTEWFSSYWCFPYCLALLIWLLSFLFSSSFIHLFTRPINIYCVPCAISSIPKILMDSIYANESHLFNESEIFNPSKICSPNFQRTDYLVDISSQSPSNHSKLNMSTRAQSSLPRVPLYLDLPVKSWQPHHLITQPEILCH
jgi:hypothetical protein